MPPHPMKKPGDDRECDDEGSDEPEREHDPELRRHCEGRDRVGPRVRFERLEQIVAGGDKHRRDGEKEGKLQRRLARHSRHLSGSDRAHRARGSGKDRRKHLDRTDPDRGRQVHLVHLLNVWPNEKRIDEPHHNAADKERERHHVEVFEILADQLAE